MKFLHWSDDTTSGEDFDFPQNISENCLNDPSQPPLEQSLPSSTSIQAEEIIEQEDSQSVESNEEEEQISNQLIPDRTISEEPEGRTLRDQSKVMPPFNYGFPRECVGFHHYFEPKSYAQALETKERAK